MAVSLRPSEIETEGAASPTIAARRRVRRTPATWVRGGGLTTFLFLLPMLLVFGAFSWYPIVRTVIMSLQHTNLVQAPTWVGLDNFRKVLHDPLLPIAVKNTAYFALLALVFGYPIPLIAAVLMSEVRRARGWYSALAYLPVVIPPVVAVLLWKTFYDGGSVGVFNTIFGWVHLGPYPWLQSPSTGDAVARARVDVGERRSHGDHLPRRTDDRELRALRGSRGRRRRSPAQGLAHHAAAAPRSPARDDDPADHRDRAGLPRAVPVHLGRAGERDADRACC